MPQDAKTPGFHIAMYVSMLIALKITQYSNSVIFYNQYQFRAICQTLQRQAFYNTAKALKSYSVGAQPQTPLGELTILGAFVVSAQFGPLQLYSLDPPVSVRERFLIWVDPCPF